MSDQNAILELLLLIIVSIIAIYFLKVVTRKSFIGEPNSFINRLSENLRLRKSQKVIEKSFAEIIEESIKIALEKTTSQSIAKDINTLDATTSFTSVSLKETLTPIFTKRMFELAIEDCHEILNRGKTVGDLDLELIIKNKSSLFIKYLIEKKDEIKMSKKDIYKYVDTISIAVNTRFADLNKNRKAIM